MPQPVKRKIHKVNKKCVFCEKKTEPDFFDIDGLRVVLSNKDRLVNRLMIGVCQKHQKRASVAVKRARHLALLPFVGRL